MEATITRAKLFKSPLSNSKYEWRWLYTVDYGVILPHIGQQTATFDTLLQARAACVRNGFTVLLKFESLEIFQVS